MSPRLRRWPLTVLTALDRLINAILLGDDRLTISARAYYARAAGAWWGWIADVIDWVFLTLFGQAEHCRKAAQFDTVLEFLTEDDGPLPELSAAARGQAAPPG